MNYVRVDQTKNTKNVAEVNMTDKKPEINNDILIADIMLRVTAMEKLLIDKKVFTVEELSATTREIAEKVAKVVIDKAQSAKNVEGLVADLSGVPKKEFNN